MGLMDILNQYANAPQAQANTAQHFDTAASQAPPGALGSALAGMFRSSATPPFGQTVGSLFGQSNPQQQAGVLNQLVQALGPAAISAGGGILGRLLGAGRLPLAFRVLRLNRHRSCRRVMSRPLQITPSSRTRPSWTR